MVEPNLEFWSPKIRTRGVPMDQGIFHSVWHGRQRCHCSIRLPLKRVRGQRSWIECGHRTLPTAGFNCEAVRNGAAALINSDPSCRYVLMDTTLSLPFIKTKDNSLFHEHFEASVLLAVLERGVRLFLVNQISLPSIELIEIWPGAEASWWKIGEHCSSAACQIRRWCMEGLIEGRQIRLVLLAISSDCTRAAGDALDGSSWWSPK